MKLMLVLLCNNYRYKSYSQHCNSSESNQTLHYRRHTIASSMLKELLTAR